MTEFSYWWTTSGTPTGDQVSSYTQAHLARIAAVLAACNGFEGVAPGYLNVLAGSVAGANTVQINTGGAIVDGKIYDNDAAVNVNVPSAVGGGNTRIDRIVLRVSWAGFAARVTRVAGTDAASPVAPAITQTSGTTYDIPLYQALVNTSGTVVLTDERTWAAVQVDDRTLTVTDGVLQVKDEGVDTAQLEDEAVETAKLADGAVTTGKLANDAVDDTKVGNRVPQLRRRQGGNASDWSVQGSTTYTPGAVRMQAGVTQITFSVGQSANNVTVTFPEAFSNRPIVLMSAERGSGSTAVLYALTQLASQVTFYGIRTDQASSETLEISWLAIGPE